MNRLPTHLLFLDETGHPYMDYTDCPEPDPPDIFLLAGCLFAYHDYTDFARTIQVFKCRHLEETHVPLVSSRIRTWRRPFDFLKDEERRLRFYQDLGAVIREARYTVFAVAFNKYCHWKQSLTPVSPYEYALEAMMERVTMCVDAEGGGAVKVIAECRGRRLDNALRLEFARLLDKGTDYIAAERLRARFVAPLVCRWKSACIPGLELADLVAYPLSNRLRFPQAGRKDVEIVLKKLYRSRKGVWGTGLKVFPAAKPEEYGF